MPAFNYEDPIPMELRSRGFTKEVVIESSSEDFNSTLEYHVNNQNITAEEGGMLRYLRTRGKNRRAAAKSRFLRSQVSPAVAGYSPRQSVVARRQG